MIVNYYPGGSVNKLGAPVKYTGSFYVKQDPNNQDNWECHLLTSGTLNVTKNLRADIFLVGGGGAGSNARSSGDTYYGGNGGGGGRTSTKSNILLRRARTYTVQIGDGGVYTATAIPDDGKGGTTSFADGVSISYTAAGGEYGGFNSGGYMYTPTKGGRSGGYGSYHDVSEGADRYRGAQPGSPRKNETFPNEYSLDSKVSAFWEVEATPYAGGGAGGGNQFDDPNPGVYSGAGQWGNNIGGEGGGGASGQNGLPNTGGGGGGGTVGYSGGNGGSGIVIIRNHRA